LKISEIYTIAEILSKREPFYEQALLLMANILKISGEDFFNQNFNKFLINFNYSKLFTDEKKKKFELRLINQLICGGAVPPNKNKEDWRPYTIEKNALLIESL
jgi:hypothetical protein